VIVAVLAAKDPFHRFGTAYGKCALLHDNLVRLGVFKDLSRRLLPILKIGGHAGPFTEGLGRGVHTDKDDVTGFDSRGNIRGEEEVSPPGAPDYLLKPRLVKGKMIGVPGFNLLLVDIDHGHAIFGAFVGDNGHRGAPT